MSQLEAAELRALVYAAFALRNGDPDEYRAALRAVEDWHVASLPGRLKRFQEAKAR